MKPDFHTLIGRIQHNTPEATLELPRVEIRLQRRRRGVRETTCLHPLVETAAAAAHALAAIAGILTQYNLQAQVRRTMLELRGDQREAAAVALVLAGWIVCFTDDSLVPQRR